MELDFLGAEQNLSVLAGSQPEYAVRFVGNDGNAIDLTDVTFDGVVTFPDGSVEPVDVTQEATDTTLLHVVFPILSEVNSYAWELRAVSEDGAKVRIACGKLGVLPTSLDLEPSEIEETEVKTLSAYLPGKAQAHVMMVWKATTRAAMAAERARLSELAAQEAADAAKESADAAQKAKEGIQDAIDAAVENSTNAAKEYAENAKKSAEEAARSAQDVKTSAQEIAEESTRELREELEELRDNTEQTRKSADATVRKLEGFLADFGDNVRSVVWVDPVTGHLIIGGVDTLCKVTGDPGKSPYINENGEWMYWDDENDQWQNGGPARGEDGFAPYVNAEGYLVYRDPLTGEIRTGTDKMYGKDGIDGTKVRRLIVQSADAIPQEGETCNGGCYYYVPLKDAPPVSIFTPHEQRTVSGSMTVNGQTVVLPAAELGATEAAESLANTLRTVFPAAVVEVDPETNSVILLGDVPYWLVRGLPETEWDLTLHVRMRREGYDVFAWCEQPDGSASWVHVGEANDLATAEIYGLTKLGTDVTIDRGAPVGTDETGAMRVPAADVTQQGTVQLSVEGHLEDGVGGIGVDPDGKIWARRASNTTYGVVKPSYTGNLESAPVIGMDAEGKLQVPFATLNQAGVVKLGSQFGQGNPIPYRVGVGADEGHHLANNLVFGGAYKHMSPTAWRNLQLPWLDAILDAHPEWFTDAYYSGLHTSLQFTQSETSGLELLSATSTLKAGVYIATNIPTEVREDAVPSASTVRDWVHAECYTKPEVDTKVQTLNERITSEVTTLNERITSEVTTLNKSINDKEKDLSDRIKQNTDALAKCVSTSAMQSYVKDSLKPYLTSSSMNNALADYYTKKGCDSRYVQGETGLMRIGRYTDSTDIVTLSKQNPDKLYIKSQKKA